MPLTCHSATTARRGLGDSSTRFGRARRDSGDLDEIWATSTRSRRPQIPNLVELAQRVAQISAISDENLGDSPRFGRVAEQFPISRRELGDSPNGLGDPPNSPKSRRLLNGNTGRGLGECGRQFSLELHNCTCVASFTSISGKKISARGARGTSVSTHVTPSETRVSPPPGA